MKRILFLGQNKRCQRKIDRTFIITPITTMILCVYSNAYACDPEDWNVCGSGSPTYTISLPDSYHAAADKDYYVKGEKVMLGYSRDYYGGGYWEIDPPSHLASGTRDMLTEIYMTDNTYAEYMDAKDVGPKHILISNPSSAYFTIQVEPDLAIYNHGDILTVTAVPRYGWEHIVPVWESQNFSSNVTSGLQRNAQIVVHAIDNYQFTLRCEEPNYLEERTGQVSLTGSGDANIYTAGFEELMLQDWNVAPFLNDSATTKFQNDPLVYNFRFSAICIPEPGSFLTYWHEMTFIFKEI